jgi:hypothetical protein
MTIRFACGPRSLGCSRAYVPFFPLGGFPPVLTPRRCRSLLNRGSNILLIPGTSSVAHLRENEVNDLRREAMALKEVVADLTLENRVLKKSVTGDGEDGE